MLSEQLRSILVCPEDRGPLLLIVREEHEVDERLREEHEVDERLREEHDPVEVLYNPRLRRSYRIEGGIPVLLVDDAVTITDEAEHQRLLARAKP